MNKFIIKQIFAVLTILAINSGLAEAQQNIQFTQYIFNSLSVNPAYAGYKEQWFAQTGIRAQWLGIEDAPQTGQVSFDGVLDPDNKKLGLGVQLTADKLGAQSSNSGYLNFAYRLPLNGEGTSRLAFGIGVGMSQYGLDYSKLSTIRESDPNVMSPTVTTFIPDARFGIHFSTPGFFAGVSILDVFANTDLSSKLMGDDPANNEVIRHQRHGYFITGGVFSLNEDIKLRPSIMWKEDFKGPSSLDVNTMMIFDDRFWIGYSYRTGVKLWKKEYAENQSLSNANSVGLIAQFFVNQNFRIGYSYDYNLNKLNTLQNGSHELTMGYTLPKRIYRSLSPRYF